MIIDFQTQNELYVVYDTCSLSTDVEQLLDVICSIQQVIYYSQTINLLISSDHKPLVFTAIHIVSVTHILLIVSCSRGLSGLFHVHIHTDTPSCCGLMTLIQVKWIGLSQPWIASKLSESLVSSPWLQRHWLTLMPSLRTHRGRTH